MMQFIDDFLNNITMYRLVLYYLILLVSVAAFFSLFGILPYNFIDFSFSVLFLVVISWISNIIFAKAFHVPANVESVYISALILALIITPIKSVHEVAFLGWAAVWTMASKYIFAIGKKHIFNPVAIAVTITALVLNQSATWWVGNIPMLPFILTGGVLIVRKIKRYDLVFSFLLTSLAVILLMSILNGNDAISTLQKTVTYSPLFFFAFVMLTEPLTTPPNKKLQIYYGVLVGFLFAPQIHLGFFYTTPETALLAGNMFSYIVSPKEKLILKLKEKILIAPQIYDFIFSVNQKLSFVPGQYMEWTLGHENPDSRGNRRYLSLASSPTENNLRVGVKFYDSSSSFKRSLLAMNTGSTIVASQLAGDFTLPGDLSKKFVFIAGGIGITPFRSMLKYMLDRDQKRNVVLFYANKNAAEIVYTNILDRAGEKLGIKTIYTLTDVNNIPADWSGKIGRIDSQMIVEAVPDYRKRIFYLSGPHSMITGFEETLGNMGIKKDQIITDFFPGFA